MDLNRIRLILNMLFMIGAIVLVILYFIMPADQPLPVFIVGTTAIVIKFSEYALRIYQNAQERNKEKRRDKE